MFKEGQRSFKKPQQEVSSDPATTDYDGDSNTSTIILEQSLVSPTGILVDLLPRTSTSAQTRDGSDEECTYCFTFYLSVLLVSLEIAIPFHHNIPVISCSVDIMDSQKTQARHYTRPSKKCICPKRQTKLQ